MNYYRCSRQSYKREKCDPRFCNAKVAHADVEGLCPEIQIRRDTAEAIRQAAVQVLAARSADRNRHVAHFAKEHASIVTREQVLTEGFTRGHLSSETYQARATRLRSRRLELERLATRPPVSDEQVLARIKKSLELATSLWDLYQPLDELRRNELLRAVFKIIVLAPEGVLGFSLNPPFDELQKSARLPPEEVVGPFVAALAEV